MNSAISIRDDKFEFTVVPDRAQGGSSLSSGSIELMLLRETIRDDGRGVEEPLMDPGQFGKGQGFIDNNQCTTGNCPDRIVRGTLFKGLIIKIGS